MKSTCLKMVALIAATSLMAACEQPEKKDDSSLQVEQTSAISAPAMPESGEADSQPMPNLDSDAAAKAAELEKCQAEGRTDCEVK